MRWFPEPTVIEAEVWSALPDHFRDPVPTEWARANRYGEAIHSFLEGPSFDLDGRLYVTDIPNGRVFRITPDKTWTLVATFEGWPNGLKIDSDGSILIADRKLGLIVLDPETGMVEGRCSSMLTEGFKGLNDLHIGASGDVYMTDQGQSGLQDPTGRVYRYTRDGRLDRLIDTGISPNGIVLTPEEDVMYVAMTRSSQIWRVPVTSDSVTTKANLFCQLPGGLSGPDGLALDVEGGLYVCHLGHGGVWRLDQYGVPTHRITWQGARLMTNLCFGGEDNRELFITESETGTVLRAEAPFPGQPMASHISQP
ncbi:MAG: SMP-30/gluconolactonase/LRE family protein [Paracoccaceae bacterium]|nr:SMP-30/gluconolactonase/LRE family protein [Paracoccaceae bacterium]